MKQKNRDLLRVAEVFYETGIRNCKMWACLLFVF